MWREKESNLQKEAGDSGSSLQAVGTHCGAVTKEGHGHGFEDEGGVWPDWRQEIQVAQTRQSWEHSEDQIQRRACDKCKPK